MFAEEPQFIYKFTSAVRLNRGVWYVHIPKDLGSLWHLQEGDWAEVGILRMYKKEKKKE